MIRNLGLLVGLISLISGCSTGIKTPQQVQSLPWAHYAPRGPDRLLAQAATLPYPDNVRLTIQAAALLLATDAGRAQQLLASVDYATLPDALKVLFALQQARLADQLGANWTIFQWLDRAAVVNSDDPVITAQAHVLRAKAYLRFSEHQAALDEWLSAMPLLNKQQKRANQQVFWQILLGVSEQHLQRLLAVHTEASDVQGWLALALLYQPGMVLVQQLTALQRWRQHWPHHPGQAYLPKDLNKLQTQAYGKLQRIALLLPLTGELAKAGHSIRDGFLAVHYQQVGQQAQSPDIILLDTEQQDINELARQAISQGAQLLIGPLNKHHVSQLHAEVIGNTPVLALNYLDDEVTATTPHFYQFGLAAEDEARMIAVRARLDGHRRAMVLFPETMWGKRTGQTFRQAWQAEGGEQVSQAAFNENTDFSQLLGQLLQLNQSHARARRLRRLLVEPLAFQARRRQDIEVIFLAASPTAARQIRPTLSYQFAHDIPIYATSSVFSGTLDPRKDQDMNGIQVPITPWVMPDHASHLRQNITQAWPPAKGTYGLLYALGADAYALYPKLQQLAVLSGSQIVGLTGRLSIRTNNRIDRELTWHVFKRGRLVPLSVHHQTTPE